MPNVPTLELRYAPIHEPLDVAQVKKYLKVIDNDDDCLVMNLIKTVRISAEKYLKASILDQHWKLTYDMYAPSVVKLHMGPVKYIDSVAIVQRDSARTQISPDVYYLSAKKTKLIFDANVIGHRVQICYAAGYGYFGSYVPAPIIEGMLSHIAAIYDGKSGASIAPTRCQALYNPYKQVSNG